MMAAVRTYLLSIVAAALLLSLALALVSDERMERVVRLVGGAVLLLVILSPVQKVEFAALSEAVSRLWLETDAAASGISVTNETAVSAVIKEKTETYILDKAAALGCDLRVEVEISTSRGYPHPSAVTLTGQWREDARRTLTRYLEENLAIAEDAQTWNKS